MKASIRFFFAICAICALVSPQAKAEEFFGHWQASTVTEPSIRGRFATGADEESFHFTVSDWKIASFLECSRKRYPRLHVFLYGIPDLDTNSGVVTGVFLCNGEINTSRCDGVKKWACP